LIAKEKDNMVAAQGTCSTRAENGKPGDRPRSGKLLEDNSTKWGIARGNNGGALGSALQKSCELKEKEI